jgi:U3 small nucleolar RNA-associated protein 18
LIQLFFLDTGTGALPAAVTRELEQTAPSQINVERKQAWYDSDDDRITVSLASDTRLRKLRNTADDDIVSGREYIERLRRQYERLHPTPEWVTYARKRRRLAQDAEENNDHDDSDSDISMADEDGEAPLSAKPLADLLRTAGSLTRIDVKGKSSKAKRKLRPEVIDIQRTKDVAAGGPSSIDSLQFHPYYPLLLSAGPSSTITLYHISPHPPNPNPILTSLHVKGTPIHTAEFCRPTTDTSVAINGSREEDPNDQTRIFFSSRRRYFHTWSLSTGQVQKITRAMYGTARHSQRTMEQFKLSPCGRWMGLISSAKKGGGAINVLSAATMQWQCSCRVDSRGGVADFAWWRDGNGFAAVGKNGEVSEYDISQRRVVRRWIDDGAVGTTIIALGGDIGQEGFLGGSRWVALGSSSGVVNIYDRRSWIETDRLATAVPPAQGKPSKAGPVDHRPKPLRSFDQLTTPTSHLEFSPDGQMLVMASRWKTNALRLVHLPTATLYRNWPTDKTPLGRISSLALSPDGGYLAVANEQGKIRLWEIRE